ncbi:MAG: hypothetical protein AAFY08_14600 [Planctomycetota bacterium]
MSTLWLRQHVDELRDEVRSLEGRIELLDEQARTFRDELTGADARLVAAEGSDPRRLALLDLERCKASLVGAIADRDAAAARLDTARIELAKALLDLDASAFVQRHNADPQQDPEPDPVEATGHALADAPALVDAEAVKPPDAPASTHVLATFRRRPRTAAAVGLAASLTAGWAAIQAVTAPSLAAAAAGSATTGATTSTAAGPAVNTARLALPMPAGTAVAANLRPAVLVAAAALAHTPAHTRADALSQHLDDLPADLTDNERDALLGPTFGDNRTACVALLDNRAVLARPLRAMR